MSRYNRTYLSNNNFNQGYKPCTTRSMGDTMVTVRSLKVPERQPLYGFKRGPAQLIQSESQEIEPQFEIERPKSELEIKLESLQNE